MIRTGSRASFPSSLLHVFDQRADVALANSHSVRSEQGLPPFAVALQKYSVGEAMTRDVIGRHAVPSAMLHGHAGFVADRLEAHLDMGDLFRRERFLPPGKAPIGPSIR